MTNESTFKRSEEQIMRKRYYDSRICPECLKPRKFLETAKGRLWRNIKCELCGAKFSVCPQTRYIARIVPAPRGMQGKGGEEDAKTQ